MLGILFGAYKMYKVDSIFFVLMWNRGREEFSDLFKVIGGFGSLMWIFLSVEVMFFYCFMLL